MDEARTLSILAWTVGGIVGAVFVLNGIALSLLQRRGVNLNLDNSASDRLWGPSGSE